MTHKTQLLILSMITATSCLANPLMPFGKNKTSPERKVIFNEVAPPVTGFLSGDNATRWNTEFPVAGMEDKVFTIKTLQGENILEIATDSCEPARTTVRMLLPGDGPDNGDVWAKNNANYVSFLCKSTRPAKMTFHLLQRGKSAGIFRSGFAAEPGTWNRVILPVGSFKMKNFANIAGVGVRVASAEPGTVVSIKNITVGGTTVDDNSWNSHQININLSGSWYFQTDNGENGIKEKWYSDTFDDSGWKVLKTGRGWQQQGIDHYGWGWYRQKIFIPKEAEGIPLTLNLVEIPSDDDTWFNGVRIGGISSEYKYKNMIPRSYSIPPSLIRYGEENTVAVRIWGGRITFIGNNSGLVKGALTAVLDPYQTMMREPGGTAVPFRLFDLSDAQRGKGFEIIFAFPAEVAESHGATLSYNLTDILGQTFATGEVSVKPAKKGVVQAVVSIDSETAVQFYLRGRVKALLSLSASSGIPFYSGTKELDPLSFAKRDDTPLPALETKYDDTPYGRLKLIDEIDCSTPISREIHPYLESGFDHAASHYTPGIPTDVQAVNILGKKARECIGYGWFAYRIGRGQLKPHTTYLLRIEYPEDKPRFAPIEIQTGQNYMDVGWRNGTGPDGVYDNWPLSKKWQWYDVIVPLDDQTVGTGGTGSASAKNGFWIYFMNKVMSTRYYAMWEGGPAVARMRLYEIDAEKHAPVIRKPEGLPHRVFSFDWERQPDHYPEDFVRYAMLMGYNSISPLILKWFFANYGEPLNGYDAMTIDARDYWAHKEYKPDSDEDATSPYPNNKSQHVRYLEATKHFGIDYVPRIEWGGSKDLPEEARSIEVTGKVAKPNRFAPWGGNLLNPLTWEDLNKFMDHLIKPYIEDNPQFAGILWRIRCDRMRVSYGKDDLEMFARETGARLPSEDLLKNADWAAGEGREIYEDWWHKKRAEFHVRLSRLLKSYRPDMTLYYYNWDGDKFGMILPANTTWAFNKQLIEAGPDKARSVYEKDEAERKTIRGEDYINVMRSGDFGTVNRADYGLRPELYKDVEGIQLFAPANYLCYADKADYLNYFQTGDGLAVSNVVPYDEINSRSINPKYEGNMLTPAGGTFSMALELLAYFHGDARTLNYTVYTYGRGFADAHRRFAQAFLALPAIPGTVIEQLDPDLKVRTYPSNNGTYAGVAYKGYTGKKLVINLPAKPGMKILDLVTGKEIPFKTTGSTLSFEIDSDPMQLHAFLIK
ncbi:MAG: hypothetical protein GX804_03805 [Lentisphaerae bacterium]|nr:hypothetical protein [Lentisphaerota bacterium]